MRLRLGFMIGVLVAALVGVAAWIVNARSVNGWLGVHTGVVDETGPYYAFWSGFGSDLAEFGIIGAVITGVYTVVRKYNCHQPGCWRVGNHPAAGGQFYLCYRHHPDYKGSKPTEELIAKLHRDHQAHQLTLQTRVHEMHERLVGHADDPTATGGPTTVASGTGPADHPG
jgi:hypothetical protein